MSDTQADKPTVTIDRKTWRRGGEPYDDGYGKTFLLNERGYMCCLGFHSLQLCGATPDMIEGTTDPRRVKAETGIGLVGLITTDDCDNSEFACSAMRINDGEHLTNEERERDLIALANAHGYRYEFTD